MPEVALADVARGLDVSAATLRRWVASGVVPVDGDGWTPAAIAQARVVARLRERGHSLDQIREAAATGRLAYGYLSGRFGDEVQPHTLRDAVRRTGLEPALIRRIWTSLGFPSGDDEPTFTDDELALLDYAAAVLESGFPLVAFLQLIRVYGQALARIADAEVKRFHLYVHEPLMRDGAPGLEMAEEMEGLAFDRLPLAAHRLRVAIAFAGVAGYTRLTEEAGKEQALDVVERFVEGVEVTLPDEARVIKTIGDEVMVVGSDPGALADWAVGHQRLQAETRPRPRIGMHAGAAVSRDGDYCGARSISRRGARARPAGGEVLVTEAVMEAAGSHLAFARIGEVTLKGFSQPSELFVARGPA